MKIVAWVAGAAAVALAVWIGTRERRADTADLRVRLAARRSVQLDRLHEYAVRGRFPMRPFRDGPLGRQPWFLDAEGSACAVGHLMWEDGQQQLVRTIAAENNRIRIPEITGGPALKWILWSGLTQEECALIQPSYEFMDRGVPLDASEVARIRTHLLRVEEQLRGDTQASLTIAIARMGQS